MVELEHDSDGVFDARYRWNEDQLIRTDSTVDDELVDVDHT